MLIYIESIQNDLKAAVTKNSKNGGDVAMNENEKNEEDDELGQITGGPIGDILGINESLNKIT